MRGVVIFGVVDARASWARFYLEQLQEGAGGIDEFGPHRVGSDGGS